MTVIRPLVLVAISFRIILSYRVQCSNSVIAFSSENIRSSRNQHGSYKTTASSSMYVQDNIVNCHIKERRDKFVSSFTLEAATVPSATTTTNKPNSNSMQLLTGCKDLINKYDVFLLDMWGVLHDGTNAYTGVIDAIQKLKECNKRLIILSNSSKRVEHSIHSLNKLGFNGNGSFDQIITSGEVAFQMLSKVAGVVDNPTSMLDGGWYEQWEGFDNDNNDRKRNVFILGSGDKDLEYCKNAGWIVSSLQDASLIISRGTFTIVHGDGSEEDVITKDDANPDRYDNELQLVLTYAAQRHLPMLICNPDKIRPDADRSPMPGRIGIMYKAALKEAGVNDPDSLIKSVGKPFSDVYNIALHSIIESNVDMSRVCMIGDALETDVAGGDLFGIDTVWVVKDGVYKPEFTEPVLTKQASSINEIALDIVTKFNQLDDTYASGRILSPTYILPHFRWE